MIENKGVKLLYCKQWLNKDDFWKVYSNVKAFKKNNKDLKDEEITGEEVYKYIKNKYDPKNKFPSLFDKVS